MDFVLNSCGAERVLSDCREAKCICIMDEIESLTKKSIEKLIRDKSLNLSSYLKNESPDISDSDINYIRMQILYDDRFGEDWKPEKNGSNRRLILKPRKPFHERRRFLDKLIWAIIGGIVAFLIARLTC